ncbi:MAG: hypothetical protein KAJ15_13350 [Spirochaetes bacterium]|nr:hypothetical protein [Spirochaetota bacterium]
MPTIRQSINIPTYEGYSMVNIKPIFTIPFDHFNAIRNDVDDKIKYVV